MLWKDHARLHLSCKVFVLSHLKTTGWKVGISTFDDMTVCSRTRSGNTQIGVYLPFIVVLNYAWQPLASLRSDHSDHPPMRLQLRTH